jgi:hypothetical protein
MAKIVWWVVHGLKQPEHGLRTAGTRIRMDYGITRIVFNEGSPG